MSQKVIFFQIIKAAQKIAKIAQAANYHFNKKLPLCFLAPNDIAQKYVDELLWKEPILSFIPHVIGNEPLEDIIVITKDIKNINKAKHIFNLTSMPVEMTEDISVLYEFDDQTADEKKIMSQNKYKHYRLKNYNIELK
jgi:DNA polymerase-3 subunit chi